eukprot:9471370-Pyramimonas_sp.AAC.1
MALLVLKPSYHTDLPRSCADSLPQTTMRVAHRIAAKHRPKFLAFQTVTPNPELWETQARLVLLRSSDNNTISVLHFMGPPVPITARVHSTPQ